MIFIFIIRFFHLVSLIHTDNPEHLLVSLNQYLILVIVVKVWIFLVELVPSQINLVDNFDCYLDFQNLLEVVPLCPKQLLVNAQDAQH